MTLIQIRSFLAVVRHGGFTAAARALQTSQTTITSQVQALEQEHGVELFERRGRRVELTSVGEEFLELARRMIGLEDDARLILGDGATLRRGSLRLGAVSPYHVIEMIEAYHARYPDMYLSMRLGNSESVLRDLEDYVCDVGVIAKTVHDERFHMRPYATYPVIAFVHKDHRIAGQESVQMEELARERLLMREPGSTTRRALEEGFERLSLTPHIAMEIGSREALREAVARGLGVGTVSRSEYIVDERLRPLAIAGDPITTSIHVCCLRERRRSKPIAAFLEAVERARERRGDHLFPPGATVAR